MNKENYYKNLPCYCQSRATASPGAPGRVWTQPAGAGLCSSNSCSCGPGSEGCGRVAAKLHLQERPAGTWPGPCLALAGVSVFPCCQGRHSMVSHGWGGLMQSHVHTWVVVHAGLPRVPKPVPVCDAECQPWHSGILLLFRPLCVWVALSSC